MTDTSDMNRHTSVGRSDTMAMSDQPQQRRPAWLWIVAIVATAAAAAGVTLALTSGSKPEPPAATSATTASRSAEPEPEDEYINFLAGSGYFPANVDGDAHSVWLRTGRTACSLLKVNGDVVAARFDIYESIIDYSAQGAAEPDLAERAVAVVEGASRFLCPEVPVS